MDEAIRVGTKQSRGRMFGRAAATTQPSDAVKSPAPPESQHAQVPSSFFVSTHQDNYPSAKSTQGPKTEPAICSRADLSATVAPPPHAVRRSRGAIHHLPHDELCIEAADDEPVRSLNLARGVSCGGMLMDIYLPPSPGRAPFCPDHRL